MGASEPSASSPPGAYLLKPSCTVGTVQESLEASSVS